VARRATYFFDVHKTASPRVLVSGAYEYARPGYAPPSPTTLKALADAYDMMGYDLGILSSAEAEALKSAGITPPSWQKEANQYPFAIVKLPSGEDIGFMRFPDLPEGADVPSPEMIDSISQSIEQQSSKVRLIVALSSWGWAGEKEYLINNPTHVPDFLLGSGPGSGANGRIMADNRCVWVRPYDRGRSISEVKILSWPDRKKPVAWQEMKNYMTLSIGLDDSYQDNPDVAAVFQ